MLPVVRLVVTVGAAVDECSSQRRVPVFRHQVEPHLRDAAARMVVAVRTNILLILVHPPGKQQRFLSCIARCAVSTAFATRSLFLIVDFDLPRRLPAQPGFGFVPFEPQKDRNPLSIATLL